MRRTKQKLSHAARIWDKEPEQSVNERKNEAKVSQVTQATIKQHI